MTRRKKPPPQHNKRRQITDSAGWTHVIKGPPATIDPTSTASHLQLRGKSPTETKYTLETYLDRFRNHYLPIWKGSTCFEKLSRILEREMLPSSVAPKNDDVVITRCVCLGLGSMTAGSESSSYELAALISILELLGRSGVFYSECCRPPHTLTDTDIHTYINTKKEEMPSLKTPSPAFTPPFFQKPPLQLQQLTQNPRLPPFPKRNRQNPPHPIHHHHLLPRPNLQPCRPHHPTTFRPHRRRNPPRILRNRRHDVPLRAPFGMPPLRHGFGNRHAGRMRRLRSAGLCG